MYPPSRRSPLQRSVHPFHTLSIWKRVLLNGVRLLQLGLIKLLDRLAPAELRFLLIHSYNTTIPHLYLVQSCQKNTILEELIQPTLPPKSVPKKTVIYW